MRFKILTFSNLQNTLKIAYSVARNIFFRMWPFSVLKFL